MSLSREMKIVIIVIVGIIVLFWGVIMILSRMLLGPRPPRPAITRGYFDFRLEYEIDGERVIIEDTIVAFFDGFSADSGSMAWYPTWRQHLVSNPREENILLLELDDGRRIYYYPPAAGHLLGYPNEREPNPNWYPFNGAFYVEQGRDTSMGNQRAVGGLDGLYNNFGIRLISWEHDPPIENLFE